MRYGTIEHVKHDGPVEETSVETVHDWRETANHTVYRESVRVKTDQETLAIFLKLQDDKKAGKIAEYGVRTFADKNGKTHRIEKTWVI